MNNVHSFADHHANQAILALKALLYVTPEGESVSMPQTRAQLAEVRKKLDGIEHMKVSVDFIDFLFEQADAGRVKLAEENA